MVVRRCLSDFWIFLPNMRTHRRVRPPVKSELETEAKEEGRRMAVMALARVKTGKRLQRDDAVLCNAGSTCSEVLLLLLLLLLLLEAVGAAFREQQCGRNCVLLLRLAHTLGCPLTALLMATEASQSSTATIEEHVAAQMECCTDLVCASLSVILY
jgi:hypothetical protein